MVTLAVQTVLGQKHFLRSFRAARSNGLADSTSDEALRVHSVRMDCERSMNGALGF
jgi:hypothetical protein